MYRKPWNTGTYKYSSCGRPSPVEEADAALHSRRNHLLYAAGADGILKKYKKNTFRPLCGQEGVLLCSVTCSSLCWNLFRQITLQP